MEEVIGFRPLEAWIDRNLVCVLENEEQVKEASPDMEKTKLLPDLLLQITARGSDYDCVSRIFAPKLNAPEDPGFGSDITVLITSVCVYQEKRFFILSVNYFGRMKNRRIKNE